MGPIEWHYPGRHEHNASRNGGTSRARSKLFQRAGALSKEDSYRIYCEVLQGVVGKLYPGDSRGLTKSEMCYSPLHR